MRRTEAGWFLGARIGLIAASACDETSGADAAGSAARGVGGILEDLVSDGDATEAIPAGAFVLGDEVIGPRR